MVEINRTLFPQATAKAKFADLLDQPCELGKAFAEEALQKVRKRLGLI